MKFIFLLFVSVILITVHVIDAQKMFPVRIIAADIKVYM